jgi:hypothetical protein
MCTGVNYGLIRHLQDQAAMTIISRLVQCRGLHVNMLWIETRSIVTAMRNLLWRYFDYYRALDGGVNYLPSSIRYRLN